MADWKQTHGPSTYLNGHPPEDAFDVPDFTTIKTPPSYTPREYTTVFGLKGEALLVLNEDKQTTIASFETMADAQTCAEALNNHKGY